MRVELHEDTASEVARTHNLDIREFARELSGLNHFDSLVLDSSWGLLVGRWRKGGRVAVTSLFLDVLNLTDGTVIDDATGASVHRWTRVARQWEASAKEKLIPDTKIRLASLHD